MNVRRTLAATLAATGLVIAGATAASAQPVDASPAVGQPATAGAQPSDSGPVGTITHSNTITLPYTYQQGTAGAVSQNVSFTFDGQYAITGGQPWDGVTSNTTLQPWAEDSGWLAITAQAGRKNSSGPADWFNAHSTSSLGADADHNGTPSELNFAFTGQLTIGTDSYAVVIGQGSNAQGNNWWIGGQGWTAGADGVINSPDGLYNLSIDWDGTTPEANAFQLASNG